MRAPDDDPGASPAVALTRVGLLRWAWRQLTSMRTALLLLLLLALAAVPGSLLPQRGVNPERVRGFELRNPGLAPWLDRLSLFDVYAAPWFAAVYLLLMISLTGCVLPRARQHWRAARAAPPPPPRHLARMPVFRSWTADAAPVEVLDAASHELRRRRYRVARHSDALAAERGFLREAGNLLFHLSLLVLLAALAVGSLYGYRGRVLVTEGEGFANTRTRYDEFTAGRRFQLGDLPPFAFTLRRFVARFEETGDQRGAPREFRADVEVTDAPGRPPRRVAIRVNQPLEVAGSKVFLTGQGYAPRFTVRDRAGQVVFAGPVKFLPRDGNYTSTGAIKIPDAGAQQVGFAGFFLPTTVIDPQRGPISVFPDLRNPSVFLVAYVGDLGLDRGVPQSVYTLDTQRMRRVEVNGQPLARALAVGDSMTVPGQGSISFDGISRTAVFQIAADPGGPLALAGALLALLGLLASLFVRRHRLWVRITALRDGTLVEVAGLTRTGATRHLTEEVATVAARLRARGGTADDTTPVPATGPRSQW